jgi:hypothetical protein
MLQIETVAFMSDVGMALPDVGKLLVISALHAGTVALLAGWLFAGGSQGPASAPRGLAWRLAAATIAYVLCYFAAGHFIAWADEAVRAYYDQGEQIDRRMVLLLQFFRGLLWSLLALFLALRLRGPQWARAAALAAIFAILGSVTLLYPNTYMPAEVATVHLVELAVSQAVWAALAGLLLGPDIAEGGARSARPPRSA